MKAEKELRSKKLNTRLSESEIQRLNKVRGKLSSSNWIVKKICEDEARNINEG